MYKWQDYKIWMYLDWVVRFLMLYLVFLALYQELVGGVIYFLNTEVIQYYKGTFFRIIPYPFFAFLLIPLVRKLFNLETKFYFNNFIFSSVLIVDIFTHIYADFGYNLYFDLPFWSLVGFDKIGHFLGGLVLSYVFCGMFLEYFNKINPFVRQPKQWAFWFTFGLFSIVFTMWEIIELLAERLSLTEFWLISSRHDTNEDLMFNTIGFLLGSSVFFIANYLSQICKQTETSEIIKN